MKTWSKEATEPHKEGLIERTKGGRPYAVRRSKKQYGFRQFDDLDSPSLKMLVICNSLTHATAVSDERTYQRWSRSF